MRKACGYGALVTAMCAMAACGANAAASPKTLVFAAPFAPTADWAVETDNSFYLTQAGVAEPLVGVTVDGDIKPGLATSWTQTDPLTWEFTLRHGVKFQNGQPFDAAAVANALTYVLHVKVPGYALNPQDLLSVTAVGTGVVRIGTGKPDVLVPDEMATPEAIILAPSAYIGNDRINPIGTGTGPFTMKASNLPQSITLKANPNYWGGPPHIQNAEIRYIPDAQTAASLLQAGDVQLAISVPAQSVPVLKSGRNLQVATKPLPRYAGLYLNNKKFPFTDLAVRQAIQSAIDVHALDTLLQGVAAPASGPFLSGAPYAPAGATPVAYDISHAQSLFASAGVDPTKLHLQLLAYTDRADLPIAAVAIQGMLSKLGITVTIKTAPYNTLAPLMLSGNYDMALSSRGYTEESPDPLGLFQEDYTCKGDFNIAQFCSPSFDSMVTTAEATSSRTARYGMYAQMASFLQANAINVFVYDDVELDGASANLHGYQIYSNEEYILTNNLAFG
jgi:peptide/nickel transport system substrate-binding protein